MKNIYLAVSFLFTLNIYASIEFDPSSESSKASEAEVSKSRACFQELSTQGCPDPGEDPKNFRSCLKNVRPSLTNDCKELMIKLYGKK